MGQRSDFSKPCQGAAEKSANATRCCCLARGSQRLGMSNVEAVDRKISWLFCFVSHECTVFARSVFSMSDYVGRCIALQSVPFFASGEQGQAEFCLHFRVGILEQFQQSRHGDGGFACGGHSFCCCPLSGCGSGQQQCPGGLYFARLRTFAHMQKVHPPCQTAQNTP